MDFTSYCLYLPLSRLAPTHRTGLSLLCLAGQRNKQQGLLVAKAGALSLGKNSDSEPDFVRMRYYPQNVSDFRFRVVISSREDIFVRLHICPYISFS